MKFNDLGLEPGLLSAVTERGYDTPTPIQAETIPPVLAGRDLLAGVRTGTGKTACSGAWACSASTPRASTRTSSNST